MPAASTAPSLAPIAPAAAHVVSLKREKECKGSVRYATADESAVVSNVYLSRAAYAVMPESIVVTIAIGK